MKKKSKGEKLADLALEFKVLQDQIRDSSGEVKRKLEMERDIVVRKYKKLKGIV